jgi:hypothetical protein
MVALVSRKPPTGEIVQSANQEFLFVTGVFVLLSYERFPLPYPQLFDPFV